MDQSEIPEYLLKRADRHLDTLQDIMNPESVQLAQVIVDYLNSGGFYLLIMSFLAYRLIKLRMK